MPPATIEMHRPIIYLDVNKSEEQRCCLNRGQLAEENDKTMIKIPLIDQRLDDVRVFSINDN